MFCNCETYFLVYNSNMKVVIIGKGLMLSNMILGAVDSGAKIVGVLRYETTTSNRILQNLRDLLNPSYEYTLMKQLKVKNLDFKSVNSEDFRQFLIKNNIDMLLVGTWREKISPQTFNIPTIGTVNVHPSLLPKYRGPNPYLQTILNGEEFSGVTLHLVDSGYDTGAILLQEKVKILPTDTSKELRERTVLSARKLVTQLFNELNSNIITPIKQIEAKATYYKNITGLEKMLDFSTQTADEISRTVRALHPFLPCYITHKSTFFVVNPYQIEILEGKFTQNKPNDIISKSSREKSLTIVCKDQSGIKFSDLMLYKGKFLTEFYISNRVKTIFGQ